MAPTITASHVRVQKGQAAILQDLSFEIAGAALTGLIGPSGSGKTTLMRAIVGAQKITSGSLVVDNLAAGSVRLRSRIGYVTQSPAVYEDLTVRQNLEYFAAAMNAKKSAVDRVLEEVDLQPQTRQLVGSLSGGERARVSLAIALLGDAPILVLDEPTVGLDPVLRRNLWDLFRSLTEQGRTLLVSSHVMDEAERCEDVLLLRAGRVLYKDSRQQLLKQTGDTSVEAAFLRLVEGGG